MKNIIRFLFAAIIFTVAVQVQSHGQTAPLIKLLAVDGTETATITNAATVTLTSPAVASGAASAYIQVNITETSGTTAGTITLVGSVDGTNWVALTDATSVPTITTKTATDVASQNFFWNIPRNPCRFYRVSWVGTGTMVDTFTAQMTTR